MGTYGVRVLSFYNLVDRANHCGERKMWLGYSIVRNVLTTFRGPGIKSRGS